ncbi:DMT family transporter [Sulfitobacter sp. TSTF-M16]|uniref:DMT family transporter n=1 Tax=Sulfitobacter aestuariivivens TaxID=2766981 RepID=A0A927HDS4_9RHOB|nr:DMT family transporter [Sulfitobacter aestuariivivens]MBD3663146.1 DMT family transporter [Sulfitobacter aestuariivivens]
MNVQKTISTRAWLEMGMLALIWGASFLTIAIALREIGPMTVVAHRVGWAAVALWIAVVAMKLPIPRAPRVWAAFLVMGLLNNVIPFGLMAWGQTHIESGLTSILNASTAIFGVLMAALFFADEKLTLRKTIGVSLGFAGVATAIGIENLYTFDLRSLPQLAVIGGTISYAIASVWARKMLSDQPPQVAAAGMVTGATLIMLPLAWITEGPITLNLAPETLAAIMYFALGATALAYLLYYRVLAMAGSGNLMLVTLMVAPIAILLGSIILGEVLTPSAYVGFALLAIGMLVIDGRVWRLHRGWAR